MYFWKWLLTLFIIQFNRVYMEPLQHRSFDYNNQNINYNDYEDDNYDHFDNNALERIVENLIEYGDTKPDETLAQFPSVDEAVYPADYSDVNPLNSLKGYFAKPSEVLENDKRSIETNAKVGMEAYGNEIKFGRTKKNRVLCRVQKTTYRHHEPGYDFLPISYNHYSCMPATLSDVSAAVQNSEHELCWVRGDSCESLSAKRYFLKSKSRHPFDCWSQIEERNIGVGCDCIEHFKFHLQ